MSFLSEIIFNTVSVIRIPTVTILIVKAAVDRIKGDTNYLAVVQTEEKLVNDKNRFVDQ